MNSRKKLKMYDVLLNMAIGLILACVMFLAFATIVSFFEYYVDARLIMLSFMLLLLSTASCFLLVELTDKELRNY
jgi:hypothetical protein